MKYLLLLLTLACAKPQPPDLMPPPPPKAPTPAPIPVPPTPPSAPVVPVVEKPVPMPDPFARFKTPLEQLAVFELELPNSTCFEWDPNPEPDVIEYHLYISEDGITWGTPRTTTNSVTACAENLIQGKAYFAMVTAKNTSGLESLPSDLVPFRTSYIVDPKDMLITSTRLSNGDMRFSFEGPAHIMEANGAVVQQSEDLVTWRDIPVEWTYAFGVHTCVVNPGDAQRAFYKMGFKW